MNMKNFVLFVLFASLHLSNADSEASQEKEEEPDRYDEGEFQQMIDSYPHFIMFYAPWCGHCNRLKPVWKELSDLYNVEWPGIITIAKVDCTKEQKICSENEVTGYPTLKLFQPGKDALRYKGARDLDSLKEFVKTTLEEAETKESGKVEVNNGLHELTSDNFDGHVATGNHFIKFFAPWCGHCKAMEPTWKELAAKYTDDSAVKIGRVDCTKNQDACKENGVKGYPTLLWFSDGKMVEKYQGSRQLQSFIEFITSMTVQKRDAPPEEDEDEKEETQQAVEVTDGLYELTEDNFAELTGSGDFYIKFFAPWCGHCRKMEPAWKELAKLYKTDSKVRIGRVDCTKCATVCKSNDVRGYPTLKYFRNGEPTDESADGRDIDSLKDFVAKMSGTAEKVAEEEPEEVVEEPKKDQDVVVIEGLSELTEENFEELVATGDYFIKFFAPWCGHCKKMEPAWLELAKEYEFSTKVKIARVDCTKHSSVCKSNGVRGYPTLKYFRDGEEVDGSPTPAGRDIDSLKAFVVRMSGTVEEAAEEPEDVVEEKQPEKDEDVVVTDGLMELTEGNFEELTASGDFFIKFFAPWCGHCRKMEPAWLELAKEYESSTTVNIARVDCTKHSSVCKSNGVRGYPTLKYFHDGEAMDGTPRGRDIDSLKAFVAEMVAKEAESKEQEVAEEQQEGEEKRTKALALDDKSFDDVIATGVTFVKFYVPWCGHCKSLAPVWDELAAEKFEDISMNIRIAELDCTKFEDICKKYDAESYPTMKLFIDGREVATYSGPRTLDDMEAFVAEFSIDEARRREARQEQQRDEL